MPLPSKNQSPCYAAGCETSLTPPLFAPSGRLPVGLNAPPVNRSLFYFQNEGSGAGWQISLICLWYFLMSMLDQWADIEKIWVENISFKMNNLIRWSPRSNYPSLIFIENISLQMNNLKRKRRWHNNWSLTGTVDPSLGSLIHTIDSLKTKKKAKDKIE